MSSTESAQSLTTSLKMPQKTLICAFVLSRLDYRNALLFGSPKHLDRLQKVQNNAAQLIYLLVFQIHVTPLLHTLHWLPIEKNRLISTLLHFALHLSGSAPRTSPQWGAADAEIKVPSGENAELKRSPFKAWSRSVYSHTCYAYCQGFLSCLFLHFQSIHLHFFQNLSRFFPVLAVANTWFLCRPAE